jgi:hypothetical protein
MKKRLDIRLASLLILTTIAAAACDSGAQNAAGPGSPDMLRDIQGIINMIKAFISWLEALSKMLGFRTIILLLAVMILSSAMSAFGLRRGKFTFLLSLGIADALWIIVEKSFGVALPEYLGHMFKANLFLLSPLAAVALIKKFQPPLARTIRNFAGRITGRDITLRKKELQAISRQALDRTIALYDSIHNSLDREKTWETVRLTTETRYHIKDLRRLLDLLENENNRLERSTVKKDTPGRTE